ncbi:MAG: NADP-dependent phosphogluconate dehydrogenase [candidate division WOR-3 bacterium]|jgi:6-phosphogluconate dehydrogenase
MDKKSDIGLIGLAVMGENLALNMESKGFTVSVFNRTTSKVDNLIEGRAKEKNIIGTHSLEEFVDSIEQPRKIFLMVKAGKPVDAVIDQITPLLSKNDILIDGGNTFFKDTERRAKEVEEKGLLYIGTGVSGGEEGALKGPSIMPGGHKEAYDAVAPILTKIAAQVQGEPCCDYMGPRGAGHYVKMVHNGIEYAIMQTIVESYDLMKDVLNLSAGEQAELFSKWNEGVLGSYLIEITGEILAKVDEETSKALVDVILDEASQKGTGKWTSQNAMDLGVPIPSIDSAVEARFISANKSERVEASKKLTGPSFKFDGDKDKFIQTVHDALYASEILAYTQGLSLLTSASKEYDFDLNLGNIAKIWRGGCIIRSKLLGDITKAYERNRELPNLLFDDHFGGILNEKQEALREVVRTANKFGVPSLVTSSSLGYYDSYRKERLPANLIQGQRDYFGAHTYRRIDKEGIFHTEWQ